MSATATASTSASSSLAASLTTTLTATSQTSSSSSSDSNNPSTFYKNLFYILIGLLAAFGIVSFLSLLRARRRRNLIIREAERLGVMVPGMVGYIPMRERAAMSWTRGNGSDWPDWWEVGAMGWGKSIWNMLRKDENPDVEAGQVEQEVDEKKLPLLGLDEENGDFLPLAIIPQPIITERSSDPVPHSDLAYFPNHLAYRPESLAPVPSRFLPEDPNTLDQLTGEVVDVVTIVRMPVPEFTREVGEGEEVLREWGGMELGIVKVDVRGGGNWR